MKKIPITEKGLVSLEQELKHLKVIERPEVIEAIRIARSFGDLSENAEYAAAKEKQGFIEGRIKEIESKLSMLDVIDPKNLSGDTVMFGATVTLFDLDNEIKHKYQIVGSDEADINNGLLGIDAPLAKALIGKSADEIVSFASPSGEKTYEIEEVKYI